MQKINILSYFIILYYYESAVVSNCFNFLFRLVLASISWTAWLCQVAEMSNSSEVKPGAVIAPLWSLYPSRWEIHSSIYLFGDREQLERLTCRHPGDLDSAANWPCPAHHHHTTKHQDTEMTCNMSPDSRRWGESSFILSLACHLLCLLAFLISVSLVFCQLMMHNIHVLFEHVAARGGVWGENLAGKDMSALFPEICDRFIFSGL